LQPGCQVKLSSFLVAGAGPDNGIAIPRLSARRRCLKSEPAVTIDPTSGATRSQWTHMNRRPSGRFTRQRSPQHQEQLERAIAFLDADRNFLLLSSRQRASESANRHQSDDREVRDEYPLAQLEAGCSRMNGFTETPHYRWAGVLLRRVLRSGRMNCN
jgi:hypothetical protein